MSDLLDRQSQPTPTWQANRDAQQQAARFSSPFLRSAEIATRQDAEAGKQTRFDEKQVLDSQKLDLEKQKYALRNRIDQSAMDDRKAAVQQGHDFLAEVDQLGQKFGVGSRNYYAGVLQNAAKYSAGIKADARLGTMLTHAQDQIGSPDAAKFFWELGQIDSFDKTLPDSAKAEWLDSLPGKYPDVVSKDPHAFQWFTAKQKSLADSIAKAQPKQAVPEGLVPSRAHMNDKGAVTVDFAAPATAKSTKEKPDSFETLSKDIEAAKKVYGDNPIAPEVQAAFEARGKVLEGGTAKVKEKESPETIVARIKAAGGTKEDAAKALKDAGHSF